MRRANSIKGKILSGAGLNIFFEKQNLLFANVQSKIRVCFVLKRVAP
jgi:hypothetical protein